jgi:hypothetical protein
MSLMSRRLPIVCAALLACFASASSIEPFTQRFNEVLSQHGVVGGGFAIVHQQEAPTQSFFGEARKGSGRRNHLQLGLHH